MRGSGIFDIRYESESQSTLEIVYFIHALHVILVYRRVLPGWKMLSDFAKPSRKALVTSYSPQLWNNNSHRHWYIDHEWV